MAATDSVPLSAPATACTIRFRGNAANPNHAAVTHLLRIYLAHLGARLETVSEGEADIHWDAPPASVPSAGSTAIPRLVVPGRPDTHVATAFARMPDGFPMPARGDVPPALVALGGTLALEWDAFSFCADILFRRADYLEAHRDAAREARCRDLPDAALGLDREPWVDRWMFRLLGHLPALKPALAALPSRARIWLTHDLDNLAKWRVRSVAGQLLRLPKHLLRGRFALLRRNWGEIAARVFTGRDPYDTMASILAMEGRRRSANFFLANGRDHLFHRYDLAKPRFRRVLKACLRGGMDAGLHGQVHFIADGPGMRAEKEKLESLAGSAVVLNRQHYLRWDAAKTFSLLEAAGIGVDSTLGYNDTPGFRCGTVWPYPWFDCGTDRAMGLLIVPLILAEFQFYDPQGFDGAAVRAVMQDYLNKVCALGGVFTVLFHNQYFHEAEFPGHSAVYQDLLAWADARGLPDFDASGTRAQYAGLYDAGIAGSPAAGSRG